LRFLKASDDPVELSRTQVEVWVPLPLSPERYFVSNLGNVASSVYANSPPRLIGGTQMSSGYLSVGITTDRGGRSHTHLVHRLVCSAFRGDPPVTEEDDYFDVLHGDNNKTNNALYNLSWGTRSDNMRDVWTSKAVAAAEGHTHHNTPDLPHKKSQYAGRTADEDLVNKGLLFHREGQLSVDDLAILWDCPRAVAYSIVSGKRKHGVDTSLLVPNKTYRTPEQKMAIRELVSQGKTAAQINDVLGETLTNGDVHYYRTQVARSEGRVASQNTGRVRGGKHHNAVLTDEAVREGLELSAQNGWGANRMKDYWGVALSTASQILAGHTWTHIPRPEVLKQQVVARGTKLDDARVAEGLRLAAEHGWTGAQLAEHLGVSLAVGGNILGGRAWTHVPRPENLTTRSVAPSLTDEQVFDGLIQAKANGWGPTALGEYLGVDRGVAHKILKGTGYKHVTRP
jgi:hypothetical protein